MKLVELFKSFFKNSDAIQGSLIFVWKEKEKRELA